MTRFAILADGPSARCLARHEFPANTQVIAINGAIRWAPRADFFFTLDPNDRTYLMFRDPRPGVTYYVAVPSDYGSPRARWPAHRRPRLSHVNYLQRLAGNGPFDSRPGLSNVPGVIHTGNSAYGGLGLAKHLGARKVALFGVDGTKARVSGGRSGPLSHLPWLFGTVQEPRIEIVNGSPDSLVDAFPRMEPLEALQWLSE